MIENITDIYLSKNNREEKKENVEKQVDKKKKTDIYDITVIGLFTALTFLFTMVNIKLPLGQGGLIHLGNIPLFLGAILFGKKAGSMIGGIGMAMFDVLNGWVTWAPFTLVVVGLMGFTMGAITSKKKIYSQVILAILVVLLIKIGGYYITEVILYHNWVAPVISIPGNITQIIVAGIVTLLLLEPAKKVVSIFEEAN